MTVRMLSIMIAIFCALSVVSVSAQTAKPGETKTTPEAKLRGYWKSTEALIEFKAGSKMTIDGAEYDYAIVGPTIIVSNKVGEMEFPYKLAGEVLTVWVEMRKVTYTRLTADELKQVETAKRANGTGAGVGSGYGVSGGSKVVQDLVGMWCYLANVQAQGGGRQSEICFTLKADGSYEYSGETSSSNTYGGSSSQSRDYGQWSATQTTLIARSSTGKTTTYTLERRNHPKTGDPMLIVDGDAFVTRYQKRPW